MKKIIFAVVIVIIIAIQFIPVEKTNPPVTNDVKWDSQKTYLLAKRACYDCHSNETVWPWYASVAPVSWLLSRDVKQGRRHLNFSTGNLRHGDDAAEQVQEGEMPLFFYLWMHPDAKLSQQEKKDFIAGLNKTFPRKPGEKKRKEM